MVATSENGKRGTKTVPRSKDAAKQAATNGAATGDLGTIQSILFGEFSSQADGRFAQLEARIAELESQLEVARGAHADSVRDHNVALGQVKADLTRTKKSSADLFEEQDAALAGLKASSVDRLMLGDALRTLADALTSDP